MKKTKEGKNDQIINPTRSQTIKELMTPRRYNFPRRKTVILHFRDLAQLDLISMQGKMIKKFLYLNFTSNYL
jgi:hypothetical protein